MYLYQHTSFLHEFLIYCYPELTSFCTGVHKFLSVVDQKLEAAPEAVTGTYQTVCLLGTAGMPYFGNLWFRI